MFAYIVPLIEEMERFLKVLKVRILRTIPVTIIIMVLNLNVQVERLET